MPADITHQIRKLIAENFLFRAGTESLPDSASLQDAGLIDSTGVLELLLLLENTFSIQVADDEVVPENLDSISRIAAFVGRKLSQARREPQRTSEEEPQRTEDRATEKSGRLPDPCPLSSVL